MLTTKNDDTIQIVGLSTDDKPILSTSANGSIFLEMDTGKTFCFDAEHNCWHEI